MLLFVQQLNLRQSQIFAGPFQTKFLILDSTIPIYIILWIATYILGWAKCKWLNNDAETYTTFYFKTSRPPQYNIC